MKICILSIVNIKHMALISLYTDFLKKKGVDFDIIYIDKYNEIENIDAKKIYRYPIHINPKWNKMKKLLAYLPFKKYAEKIIDKNKYDYVIVWRTETALMFSRYLIKNMKKKFCLNIRDYCYENNYMVYRTVKEIVKNADFTTISSEGFKSFLPPANYVNIHSFNESLLEGHKFRENNIMNKKKISICFIGSIRFLEPNKKLMLALKNDERFNLQFFGQGSDQLKEYADNNNILNTEFYGGFEPSQTSQLLDKADVINNLFGSGNPAVDTLTSIRFYYSVYLRKPIIVNANTYMEKLTDDIGNGYPLRDDNYEKLGDNLYEWLSELDYKSLEKNSKDFLETVRENNMNFTEMLNNKLVKR